MFVKEKNEDFYYKGKVGIVRKECKQCISKKEEEYIEKREQNKESDGIPL